MQWYIRAQKVKKSVHSLPGFLEHCLLSGVLQVMKCSINQQWYILLDVWPSPRVLSMVWQPCHKAWTSWLISSQTASQIVIPCKPAKWPTRLSLTTIYVVSKYPTLSLTVSALYMVLMHGWAIFLSNPVWPFHGETVTASTCQLLCPQSRGPGVCGMRLYIVAAHPKCRSDLHALINHCIE